MCIGLHNKIIYHFYLLLNKTRGAITSMAKGSKTKVFKPGDYVFAKVKGYPAWPAKITILEGKKYKVRFYGTGEISSLLAKDLFDYSDHKKAFTSKENKRPFFNQGLVEIDTEISNVMTNDVALDRETPTGVGGSQESMDASPAVANSVTDSMEESIDTSIGNDADARRTISGRKTSPRFSDQGLVSPKSEPRSPIAEVAVRIERLTPNRYYKEDTSRTPVLTKPRRKRSKISPTAEEKVFPFTLPFASSPQMSASTSLAMPGPSSVERVSTRDARTVSAEQEKLSKDLSHLDDTELNRRGFLAIEIRLIELDFGIKESICVNTPDPASCIMLLTQLNNLEIYPLMLLKNPGIVDTIMKCVDYVGMPVDPELRTKDDIMFVLMAAKIRLLSQQCIDKFTMMFQIEAGETFWVKFTKLLDRFKMCTALLTPIDLMQMVREPFEIPPPIAFGMKLDNWDAIKVEKEEKQRGKSSEKSSAEIASTPKSKAIKGTKRRNTQESRGTPKGK